METDRVARRWWLVPLLLAALAVPLVPAAPAGAAPGETGKYYIVKPPVDGQREFLYSIALRTLGNGNRFREIVDLNRGRKQPDGATFTDGVELAPGWVLVLPENADGPGVRTGPLPAIGPKPTPPRPTPVRPTPTPTPSAVAPTRSAPTPDHSPRATASPAVVDGAATGAPHQHPQSHADPSGPGWAGPLAIRIGAGALAVLLLAVALVLLRRGAYRMRPVGLDDGPWPPPRHHTPTPAELDVSAEPTPPQFPLTPRMPLSPPALGPPPAAAPDQAAGPDEPEIESGLREPEPDEPEPTAGRLADVRTDELAHLATPHPPQWPLPARREPEWHRGPSEDSLLPRPELPTDGDVPYVRADVISEVGPILVRMAGVTTGQGMPAYAWLKETEAAPDAAVPLVLGHKGPWRLHVDLGRTPDVFTLVGAEEDCRRLAAAFARQLHAAGIGVTVLGDALGAEVFDGCRSVNGFPEPGEAPDGPHVVISAGLPAGDTASVRGLVAATGGRCVPMVIGPVPNGRWSAQLGAVA